MANVEGWAFKAPEAQERSREAFLEALDKLDITRPEINERGGMVFTRELSDSLNALITGKGSGYAHFTATLDPRASDLTAQQKLLIADHGNGCFGGTVSHLNVKVYTD